MGSLISMLMLSAILLEKLVDMEAPDRSWQVWRILGSYFVFLACNHFVIIKSLKT